jgi:hypothetical protein
MNADGDLVVTPAERHREKLEALKKQIEQAGGNYSDLERSLAKPPGELDSRGRLTIPPALRSWLFPK